MVLDIIFREKDEKSFWNAWGELLLKTKAGPRYLQSTIQYKLERSENLQSDKSFVAFLNGKPVSCVFLPVEKHENFLMASFRGEYLDAPLFENLAVQKAVFSSLDEIAKDNALSKIMFAIDPLAGEGGAYNYLQKYGYLDTSLLSYVIDLAKFENLLNGCRENHRRSIKEILNNKDFEVFYMDETNPSYEIHEEYRLLHHKASGRATRSKKTFDMQFEKLKQGNAALVGLRYKQKNIASLYFEHNFDKALYVSGADDPAYAKFPLYHVLMYSAMEYFKKRGVRELDTSQPSSPSLQFDYYPDEKQLNIALFKRGFGGDFKPLFRGVKYFSKELFEKDMKTFISQYEQKIF